MTVILGYSSSTIAFLAADSCRFDLIEKRKLPRVDKLHTTGHGQAVAIGGQNIDRTRLAMELLEARRAGVPFEDAARAITPRLFENVRRNVHFRAGEHKQSVTAWYAECVGETCSLVVHDLPSDQLCRVIGFRGTGPDTELLSRVIGDVLKALQDSEGGLQLDLWAAQVIAEMSNRFPNFVGLPGKAIILRAGQPDASCELAHNMFAEQAFYVNV